MKFFVGLDQSELVKAGRFGPTSGTIEVHEDELSSWTEEERQALSGLVGILSYDSVAAVGCPVDAMPLPAYASLPYGGDVYANRSSLLKVKSLSSESLKEAVLASYRDSKARAEAVRLQRDEEERFRLEEERSRTLARERLRDWVQSNMPCDSYARLLLDEGFDSWEYYAHESYALNVGNRACAGLDLAEHNDHKSVSTTVLPSLEQIQKLRDVRRRIAELGATAVAHLVHCRYRDSGEEKVELRLDVTCPDGASHVLYYVV